jgi:hypothetical protein
VAYGHAERNLVLIRQLEAETIRLLVGLDQPNAGVGPRAQGEAGADLQGLAGGAAAVGRDERVEGWQTVERAASATLWGRDRSE